MTAGHPSANRGVDLDLLADFAGGTLEGTPDQERVQRLIDTDPEWAAALAELRSAQALVAVDLAALADRPVRMPDDIATRLHAALAAAEVDPTAADARNSREPESVAPVVPLRSRRRRYAIAAAAAVAAGVVGLGGYTWYAVTGPQPTADTTASQAHDPTRPGDGQDDRTASGADTAGPDGAEAEDQPAVSGFSVPVSVSGRNYTRADLTTELRQPGQATDESAGTLAAPPARLERLMSPDALSGCLSAVTRAYPGEVARVDFARFEGDPALIITIRQQPDGERIVVAGPDCRESDADARYTVTT